MELMSHSRKILVAERFPPCDLQAHASVVLLDGRRRHEKIRIVNRVEKKKKS